MTRHPAGSRLKLDPRADRGPAAERGGLSPFRDSFNGVPPWTQP
jgi:hypothetical protein